MTISKQFLTIRMFKTNLLPIIMPNIVASNCDYYLADKVERIQQLTSTNHCTGQRNVVHGLGRIHLRGVRDFLRPWDPQHPNVRVSLQANGQAEGGPRMSELPRDSQQRRHAETDLRADTVRGILQSVQFHLHRLRSDRRGHLPGDDPNVQTMRPDPKVSHPLRGVLQVDPQREEELQVTNVSLLN